MSDDSDIDEQLRGQRDAGGASIHVQDPRVSKALGWFWGVVGMALTSAVWIAANNLYQLNVTVARGIESDIARDRRIDDHETRLRQVEREVNTLAGRNLRGGPEKQEASRGR